MKRTPILSLVLATLLMGLVGTSNAQSTGTDRERVKMDRDTFLSLMRWDEPMSMWVLKSNMQPPAGVVAREEIKTMRDKFLSMHTWSEVNSDYVAVKGAPRDMKTMTREQVDMETARFNSMFRWDEPSSNWVKKSMAAK